MPRLPRPAALWCLLPLFAAPAGACAQATIQAVFMEAGLAGPRTLFRAGLLNAGPALEVSLEGEVRERGGGAVVSFRSEPFHLAPGVRQVGSSELAFRSFVYGGTPAGREVQRFHRFPGGDYRYCLRLVLRQGEGGDEYCDVLHVDELLFLDLVHPWDGDTVDDLRPPLTWMLSGSAPTVAQGAEVRIVLSPKAPGESPAQALAGAVPLFMVPHVQVRTMPYPPGVPGLERGRCYAWQAELLDGGRVRERSEPWGFCVREHEEPVPNKYVRLDRVEPGAIYEVTDGRIYFRYDEPYASGRVDCSIYDGRGRATEPELAGEGGAAGGPGARSVGVNLYELDLQPYRLGPGYYDLVVRNEKGRPQKMKFHIAR